MPAMANITVLKNDGVTNQVYTAQSQSAGDKSPAIWQNLSVGTAKAHRPELRILARANANGTAKLVEGSFKWPETKVGSDGKTYISDTFRLNFTGIVPLSMTETELNEAASQGLNLAASTLVKDQVKSGYAAS